MLGRALISGSYDATKLRSDILELIRNAWRSENMVAVEEVMGQKRRRCDSHGKESKRHKSRRTQ